LLAVGQDRRLFLIPLGVLDCYRWSGNRAGLEHIALLELPNSIVVNQTQNIVILRDYFANIRQELLWLETLETTAKDKR